VLLNVSNVETNVMNNTNWEKALFNMHRRNQRVMMVFAAGGVFDSSSVWTPTKEDTGHGC